MADQNKKSLSYKIQKNPFSFVLLIIVMAVALFGVVNLVPIIKENINKPKEEATTTVADETVAVTAEDNSVTLKNVKNYLATINSVKAEVVGEGVAVTVEFADKETLLKEHSTDRCCLSE